MMEIDQSEFERRLAEGALVVDFSAEWCPPCRVMMPWFERAAARLADRATFATVDVERNQRLAVRFRIEAMPSVVVFRDGQPVRLIRGLRDEKTLVAEIEEALDAQ